MKKFWLLLLFCCFLTGCGNQELKLNGNKVHFFEEQIMDTSYQLSLPTTFLSLTDEMMLLRFGDEEHPDQMLVSRQDDAEIRMLDIEKELTSEELPLYLETLKKAFDESETEFHYLTNEVKTLDQKEVAVLEYQYQKQEENYYGFLLYFEESGILKEIYFTAHGDEVATWQEIGKRIISSFKKVKVTEDED